jgi:hypothetical protein
MSLCDIAHAYGDKPFSSCCSFSQTLSIHCGAFERVKNPSFSELECYISFSLQFEEGLTI